MTYEAQLAATALLTETEAAARLGAQLTEPHIIETNDMAAFVALVPRENGAVDVVDLQEYAASPRASGERVVEVFDPESLLGYADRYAHQDDARVVHDPFKHTITLIVDDSTWGRHRCTLRLRETSEWVEWLKASGLSMTQAQFAELVEDHLPEFHTPDGATMLEIAQTFHASENSRFVSGTRLSSGETRLVYEQNIDAKAGTSGAVEVPEVVKVLVRPFEGGEPVLIKARFRYRLKQGSIGLGFVLDRPHAVQRQAFDEMSTTVVDELAGWLHTVGTP